MIEENNKQYDEETYYNENVSDVELKDNTGLRSENFILEYT